MCTSAWSDDVWIKQLLFVLRFNRNLSRIIIIMHLRLSRRRKYAFKISKNSSCKSVKISYGLLHAFLRFRFCNYQAEKHVKHSTKLFTNCSVDERELSCIRAIRLHTASSLQGDELWRGNFIEINVKNVGTEEISECNAANEVCKSVDLFNASKEAFDTLSITLILEVHRLKGTWSTGYSWI